MTEEVEAATKLDTVVQRYIMLRDKKSALKKQYDADVEAIDTMMEKAEAFFLGYMRQNGLTSLPTAHGTPYRGKQTSATVADRQAFLVWLMADPERIDGYLDVKANKSAVNAMAEETGEVPPGIDWSVREICNVRREK
jgi:hypothetical protein